MNDKTTWKAWLGQGVLYGLFAAFIASPCVDSDLIAGFEISFSSAAPWHAGHAGAGVVFNTSASNSLPQLLQAYSKIGMTPPS